MPKLLFFLFLTFSAYSQKTITGEKIGNAAKVNDISQNKAAKIKQSTVATCEAEKKEKCFCPTVYRITTIIKNFELYS